MTRDFTATTTNYPTGADRPLKRVMVHRAPLASDFRNFIPGDEWLDTSLFNWWKFVKVSGSPPIGKWILLGSGNLESLTGNVGGTVLPDPANNINILGAAGVVVTGNPGTNTLTITSNIATIWQIIVANQTLVVNNGYFTNGVGPLQLALPAASGIGDTIQVADIGGNGWQITQAPGQQIRLGKVTTTLGLLGNLMSTDNGDHLTLVCVIANTFWIAFADGNITVV